MYICFRALSLHGDYAGFQPLHYEAILLLGRDDCWLFVFQSSYVLRGGRWEKNLHNMLISFVVKSLQSQEENYMLIFLKNVMTNALLTLPQRFQERR